MSGQYNHTQEGVYPQEPGHVKGSETSMEGANAIKPHRQTVCQKILSLISSSNGMTSSDVLIATGMKINSITARLREMELSGALEIRGKRPCQQTGVNKNIYVATGVPHIPQKQTKENKLARFSIEELMKELSRRWEETPSEFRGIMSGLCFSKSIDTNERFNSVESVIRYKNRAYKKQDIVGQVEHVHLMIYCGDSAIKVTAENPPPYAMQWKGIEEE